MIKKVQPILISRTDWYAEHKLWQMLNVRTGASLTQYLNAFERRNLVGVSYDPGRIRAKARAYEIVVELRDSGRTIVLLGNAVREAFHFALSDVPSIHINDATWFGEPTGGLPPLIVHPQQAGGCTWRQIPHPSGRNRWYNDPKNVRVVELLMEELYVAYRQREKVA